MKLKKKTKVMVTMTEDEHRTLQNVLYDYSRVAHQGTSRLPAEYLTKLTDLMNGLREPW